MWRPSMLVLFCVAFWLREAKLVLTANITVIEGDCTISDVAGRCIDSPNYPSLYSANHMCEITVPEPGFIEVLPSWNSWRTEPYFDYLVIGGIKYSGWGEFYSYPFLPGVPVAPGTITWTSDHLKEETGWRICVVTTTTSTRTLSSTTTSTSTLSSTTTSTTSTSTGSTTTSTSTTSTRTFSSTTTSTSTGSTTTSTSTTISSISTTSTTVSTTSTTMSSSSTTSTSMTTLSSTTTSTTTATTLTTTPPSSSQTVTFTGTFMMTAFINNLEIPTLSFVQAFINDPDVTRGVETGIADMASVLADQVSATLSLVRRLEFVQAPRLLTWGSVRTDYVVTVPAGSPASGPRSAAYANSQLAAANSSSMHSAVNAGLQQTSPGMSVSVSRYSAPSAIQGQTQPSHPPPSSTEEDNTVPVEMILGGIVGGCVLCLLCGIAATFCKRNSEDSLERQQI